jgi:hypothetical protein
MHNVRGEGPPVTGMSYLPGHRLSKFESKADAWNEQRERPSHTRAGAICGNSTAALIDKMPAAGAIQSIGSPLAVSAPAIDPAPGLARAKSPVAPRAASVPATDPAAVAARGNTPAASAAASSPANDAAAAPLEAKLQPLRSPSSGANDTTSGAARVLCAPASPQVTSSRINHIAALTRGHSES